MQTAPAQNSRIGHSREQSAHVVRRGLALASSPTLTLVIFIAVIGAVVWVNQNRDQATWALAVPLGALSVNLAAAMLVRPIFREKPALTVFHLALLAILLLVAVGRMTYMKGRVEVSTGARFDGVLTDFQAGPWHPWHLDEARFTNEGFEIRYAPGPKRLDTSNRVSWRDRDGGSRSAVIGDRRALVRAGYRFYTSFNKGFAPVFTWLPAAGAPVTGDVHLPGYPGNALRQSASWSPPGASVPLWVMLTFDEPILLADAPSRFRPPREHRMVVRSGDRRYELAPGETANLAGGNLAYHGLRTWMGYSVFYDPTRPWLVAACVLAVAALGWHFWSRFAARPWIRD